MSFLKSFKFNLKTLIYFATGFIYGSVFYLISKKLNLESKTQFYYLVTLTTFTLTNTFLLEIKYNNDKKMPEIKYLKISLPASVIITLLFYYVLKINTENYPSSDYSSFYNSAYVNLVLLFIFITTVLYIKTFLKKQYSSFKELFNYDDLLNTLSEYTRQITFSVIILGGIWIILGLWSALFDLINIKFFSRLLFENIYPPLVLSTTTLFAAYGISQNNEDKFENFLIKIKNINFFGFFLEIISFFLILFIILLPFKGLQTIFKSQYPSLIMLGLNAIGLFLIQFTDFENGSTKRNFLIKTFIILEPVFSLLAFYSIMLRINQYGILPNRFITLVIITVFLIFDISYFYSAIKYKDIKAGIKKFTAILTPVIAFLLFITTTPLLNPYEISVYSQLSLFGNDIKKLDLPAFKFKLSNPGIKALKELEKKFKNDKEALKLIEKVKKCDYYYSCLKEKETETVNYPKIKIYPENYKNIKTLHEILKTHYKTYYYDAKVIIKDFSKKYEGEEIVIMKDIWIMGKYTTYRGILAKDSDGKYKIIKEEILKTDNNIDYNNLNLNIE